MIILTIFFFITAILYSSIGFGGGSTYLALLLIWDVPYYIFPILALICNIIVVSGNSINFLKSKNINFNLLYPYLIGSIPLAFIGASVSIDKHLFEILLFFILILAGIFLLIESKSFNKKEIVVKKIAVMLIFFCSGLAFRSHCPPRNLLSFSKILLNGVGLSKRHGSVHTFSPKISSGLERDISSGVPVIFPIVLR